MYRALNGRTGGEKILQALDTKPQSPALPLLSLSNLTLPAPHQPSTHSYNFNIGYSLPPKQNFPSSTIYSTDSWGFLCPQLWKFTSLPQVTGQLALTALVGSCHGFGHPDESLKVYFMERAEFWLCRRSNTEEHFCLWFSETLRGIQNTPAHVREGN